MRFDVFTAMTIKYIICQWVNLVWLHCSTLKIKAETSANQHKITRLFMSDYSTSSRSMSQLCQSQISHSLNLLNERVSTPCNSNSYTYNIVYNLTP
jgi:hypothetical protein